MKFFLQDDMMSRSVEHFRLFLSSPGDLSAEREIVRRVCNQISLDQGRLHGFHIDVLTWETDVHPTISRRSQQAINDQIGQDYEIYLGLMGARFGSDTGKFGSGTEEEFHLAVERWLENRSPEIMFYFINKAVDPFLLDRQQFERVVSFQRTLRSNNVLYFTAANDIDLERLLHSHLTQVVHGLKKRVSTELGAPSTSTGQGHITSGPLKRWELLLQEDAEVLTQHLASEAAKGMNSFTATTESSAAT